MKVKFSMLLEIDNKGKVYLTNHCIMERISRHAESFQWVLHEMKDQVIFQVSWISGYYKEVNFLIKKFPGSLFEKYCVKFNGEE